jgi:cytochrome d ubiquinol oxidase subunit II
MILLWLLILRGVAIEFRSHLEDAMWRAFWDTVFTGSSAFAAALLGTAFANLMRGVPLQADGWFSLSLFESFSPRGRLGLLDWYTLLGGLLALAAMTHHGALFLAWHADGAVRARALTAASRLLPITAVIWTGATIATIAIAPLSHSVASRPAVLLSTGVALLGLVAAWQARRSGQLPLAFAGSSAFMAGIVAATAAALYPVMINSVDDSTRSLTVLNSAAGPESLRAGLMWWPAGFVLAAIYLGVVFRLHRRRVNVTR